MTTPISSIPPSNSISRRLLDGSNISTSHQLYPSTQFSLGSSGQVALPSFQTLWRSIQRFEEPRCHLNLSSTPKPPVNTTPRDPVSLASPHDTIPLPNTYAADPLCPSDRILLCGAQYISLYSNTYTKVASLNNSPDDLRGAVTALNYVAELEEEEAHNSWKAHIQEVGAKDKGNDLVMCLHTKKQKQGKATGRTKQLPDETCGYIATKQTVKRHINSIHLRISPFLCTFCGSRFGQRQAAVIHVNSSHLGIKNICCEFCAERFSDPSRKNKHVYKVHRDLTSQIRSRRKNPYANVPRRCSFSK